MNILVTGGAGFIGSNFLNLFVPRYSKYNFINFDKLTYAANLLNLKGIENSPNYTFEQGDIADYKKVIEIFARYNPDIVITLLPKVMLIEVFLVPLNLFKQTLLALLIYLKHVEKNGSTFNILKIPSGKINYFIMLALMKSMVPYH